MGRAAGPERLPPPNCHLRCRGTTPAPAQRLRSPLIAPSPNRSKGRQPGPAPPPRAESNGSSRNDRGGQRGYPDPPISEQARRGGRGGESGALRPRPSAARTPPHRLGPARHFPLTSAAAQTQTRSAVPRCWLCQRQDGRIRGPLGGAVLAAATLHAPHNTFQLQAVISTCQIHSIVKSFPEFTCQPFQLGVCANPIGTACIPTSNLLMNVLDVTKMSPFPSKVLLK